jgi:hypothetical protein
MEGVLAALAQFDNDVRSDRTGAGMRAALELGRWTFPATLGYLNAPKLSGKSVVHDPDRAELVKRAFEGPQWPLRVLPLPAPVPSGEREQGRARRRIRRRAGPSTADALATCGW